METGANKQALTLGTGSRRIVYLDKVRQNNIVLEEPSKDSTLLNQSVFQMEYRQIASIINKMVRNNNQRVRESGVLEQGGWGSPVASARMYSALEKPNWSEYQTTIPFIGDRGTGKSSLMYTVLRELGHHNPEKRRNFLELDDTIKPEEISKCSFICLDVIDVATMKSNENIMELILARMLSYLKRQDQLWNLNRTQRTEMVPDLYRQMDELAKIFKDLYREAKPSPVESGLESLQKIAQRQEAVDKFQQLVQTYTGELCKKLNLESCYLVLALDDLDMYKGSETKTGSSHFALLEQICDYLRIPNLLVLLTFNERILKRNCMSHFRECYFDALIPENSDKEEIEELSQMFLSKLFPRENRVYVPNFRYVDSVHKSNLYVVPYLDGTSLLKDNAQEEQIKKKCNGDLSNNRELQAMLAVPVKEFMLRLIAQKTGVYFDICGRKPHFFEPRKLRELGAMFQLFYSWPSPNETQPPKMQEQVRARNRQRLLNYLRNQYAVEHLTAEEYRKFLDLSSIPLSPQGRYLVDEIRQYRMYPKRSEDELGYLEQSDKDRWKYSYGELMHNLYFSTRVSSEKTGWKTLYRKPFVSCILGSQTVLLNQMLHDGFYTHVLSFIGSSVGGRWTNDMLPAFSMVGSVSSSGYLEMRAKLGSISTTIQSFANIPMPNEINFDQEQSDGLREDYVNLAKALGILASFFTSYPEAGLGLQFRADRKDGKLTMSLVSTSKDSVCFNALNPFLNLHVFDSETSGETPNAYLREFVTNLYQSDYHLKCSIDTVDHSAEIKAAQEAFTLAQDEFDKQKEKAKNNSEASPADVEQARKDKEATEKYYNDLLEFNNMMPEDIQTWYKTQFAKEWDTAVKTAEDSFLEYGKNAKAALPIAHIDMMYNILKRVSSVSYHDIPEEAGLDSIYPCFVQLYERIAGELENQDSLYGTDLSKNFRNSMFYRMFTASAKDSQEQVEKKLREYYNPYLKQLFTSMMKEVLAKVHARESVKIYP